MYFPSESDEFNAMLSETSGPRQAVSRTSKFVIVAIIGLLLALIEQVVGYSTNYWMLKGFGASVYHTEGLWQECFCSSSCYCYSRESSADNRIRVASVFETLGLAGLIAVLVLTILGVFKKNHKTVIKVTSAVTGFVTCALIFAGVVGIGVTAASDPYITLHFSFALCAKAGAMTLISAFLIIVDIRPRYRASEHREHIVEETIPEDKKPARKKRNQRPATLGEYLSRRNNDTDDENRRDKEAGFFEQRRQRHRKVKEPSESEDYSNKIINEDRSADDDQDNSANSYAYRSDKRDNSNVRRNRKDKYAYENRSADLYDNDQKRFHGADNSETDFNETMQYATLDHFGDEFQEDAQYLAKHESDGQLSLDGADDDVAKKLKYENKQQSKNNAGFSDSSLGQYEYQNRYSDAKRRHYPASDHYSDNSLVDSKYGNEGAESHDHSNNKIPQLRRSPNASETRRQNNWAARYDADYKNYGYNNEYQTDSASQDYRRRRKDDFYTTQTSPSRNNREWQRYENAEPYGGVTDNSVILSSSYTDAQEARQQSRTRPVRSNETTV